MPPVIIDNCAVEVEITPQSAVEKVVITCDDDPNAPPPTGRFEYEFFNQSTLFISTTAHRLPSIRDAFVLDLQRTKTIAEVTINHSTLSVAVQFLTPQSGYLVIF